MAKWRAPKGLEAQFIKAATEGQVRGWVAKLRSAGDYHERLLTMVALLQWAKKELDGPEIVRQIVRRGNFYLELEDAATRLTRIEAREPARRVITPSRESLVEKELERLNKLGRIRHNPTVPKLFQEFHGNPPARVRKVSVKTLKDGDKLVKWGRIIEITYEPEPPSKYAGEKYYHKFGDYGLKFGKDKPILATDEAGDNLYIIKDKSRFKLGSRGIVG